MSGKPAKPNRKKRSGRDSVRREYDFTGGTRGKYANRYARGSNVVVLDPDVAEKFKTAEQVNEALRAYLPGKAPRRRRASRRIAGR